MKIQKNVKIEQYCVISYSYYSIQYNFCDKSFILGKLLYHVFDDNCNFAGIIVPATLLVLRVIRYCNIDRELIGI